MNIRPSLIRKRTRNLDVLEKEKRKDSSCFEDVFEIGENIVSFVKIIEEKIGQLKNDNVLSESDKDIIIVKLIENSEKAEKVYDYKVADDCNYFIESATERIAEIKIALKSIDSEIYEMKKTSFSSNSINKDKILRSMSETKKTYLEAYSDFSRDLDIHIKRIKEQQKRIEKKQEL